MFTAISSKLTLTAMLAHAMLGCWWHHGHAWVVWGSEAATVAAEARELGHHVRSCCAHSAPADGHDQSEDRYPHPCPVECDEGTCIYISSAPVELPALERCTGWCDVLPPAIGPEAGAAVEVAARGSGFVTGGPPGVRLVELLQVRLI